jgi:hypothetical protein
MNRPNGKSPPRPKRARNRPDGQDALDVRQAFRRRPGRIAGADVIDMCSRSADPRISALTSGPPPAPHPAAKPCSGKLSVGTPRIRQRPHQPIAVMQRKP